MPCLNNDLRLKIAQMVINGGGGHIPSSFSVVDIIDSIYDKYICNSKAAFKSSFTLSKGHAAVALYVVLNKYGFLSDLELDTYLNFDSILGGHPDATKVPGAEASTGSLGHGLSFTLGRALASSISSKNDKFFVLVGDGECHEGTIWESAIVANNLKLKNLILLVDYNKSSDQICPHNSLIDQFKAFGWYTQSSDGHNQNEIHIALDNALSDIHDRPKAIVFNTIKGKGVSFMEGHGPWHYKIPNENEFALIKEELFS